MKTQRPAETRTAKGMPAAIASAHHGATETPVEPLPISRPARSSTRQAAPNGLIPPHEMFGGVLSGRLIIDANLLFSERVERAWQRLMAGFEEDEHERLREVLMEVVTKEVNDEQK